jgi:hypothetical protein
VPDASSALDLKAVKDAKKARRQEIRMSNLARAQGPRPEMTAGEAQGKTAR